MSDSSIKRSNMYADLVRQQLHGGDRDGDAASIKSNRSAHSYRSEHSLITDKYHGEGEKLYDGEDLRGQFSKQSSRAPSNAPSVNGDGRYSGPHTPQPSHNGSRAPSVHEGSRAGSVRGDEQYSNGHYSNQGSRAPSVVNDQQSAAGSRAPSVYDDRVSNHGSRAASVHDEQGSVHGSRAPSVRSEQGSIHGSRAPSVHDDAVSNHGSRVPSVRGSQAPTPSIHSNQGSRPPSVHEEHYSNHGSRPASIHDGSRVGSVNGEVYSQHGDSRYSNGGSRAGSVHEGSRAGSIAGDQGSRAGSVQLEDAQIRGGSRPGSGVSNRPPSAGSQTGGSVRPPSAGSARPPSAGSSRPGSVPVSARSVESSRSAPGAPPISSRAGSVASSERELSQFFEGETRQVAQHRQSPQTFTDQIPQDLRNSGTASLPILSPQRSQSQDKRSYTPDTYTRSVGSNQPKVQSPLVTSRMMPVSRSSSQAPTPVIMNGAQPSEEDDALSTYKKLLADRDVEARSLHQEIDALKKQLRTLNDSSTSKYLNRQDNDQVNNDLLKEKENVETENWKLKQEIEQLRHRGLATPSNSQNGDGLNSFSRNSPNVLQRKIEDLESQIQDLQEANEKAVEDITHFEKVNQELQGEVESLRTANNLNLEDLQSENQRLRDQIDQMNEQHTNVLLNEDGNDDTMQLRSDIQQMRVDMRSLREKNHQLNEENIQLRDDTHDLKRGLGVNMGSGRLNDTQSSGERLDMMDRMDQYRKEKNAALDEVRALKDQLFDLKKSSANVSPPAAYSDHVTSYLEQQDSYLRPSEERFAGKFRAPNKWDGPQVYSERSVSPAGSDKSDSTALLMTGFGHAPVIGDNFESDLPDVIEEEPSPRDSHKGLLSDPTNTDLKYYDSIVPAAISETSSVSSIVDNFEDMTLINDVEPTHGSPRSGAGFRSVSPPLTVTQHNKGDIGTGREPLSTAGKRPFAPRSPADVNLGDIVKFTNKNGKISRGTVKYLGHLPGRNECYLGLELEYSEGKHDGVYMGQRYFKCKPNKGVFVAFNKIVMVWGH